MDISPLSITLFYIVTFLPVAALAAAAALVSAGIYLKIKKRPCKKIFIWAVIIFIFLIIIYALPFALAGFIGIGPGLGD